MKPDYDIIIAGGGMVGMSLALMCARRLPALKILLLEPQTVSIDAARSEQLDTRCTALSYRSYLLFQQLGLWEDMQPFAAAVNAIHVSEQSRFGHTLLSTEQVDWPALGYVVENNPLIALLLERLAEQKSITRSHAAIASVSFTESAAQLQLNNDEHYTAALLILANGAESANKQQLGLDNSMTDYQQTAIVTNLALADAHGNRAFERFTELGPMAVLPLPGNASFPHRASLVWSCPNEQLDELMHCEASTFIEAFQQAFARRLGVVTGISQRVGFPLKLITAKEQCRSRLLLMGNAAHALHPLAGQGFNLSLRDCQLLIDQLACSHANKADLGELGGLQAYVSQRQQDQLLAAGLSDSLTRVFTHANPVVGATRALALSAMDFMPTVKQQFIKQAAGMR